MQNNGYKIKVQGYIDISDYARPVAVWIGKKIRSFNISAYQVTIVHFTMLLIAIYLITQNKFWYASFLILIKNVLDALDGTLARLQNKPSRVGRFLDSNLDFIGNFLLFLFLPSLTLQLKLISFLAFILQGSFFNYYSVLFRSKYGGDSTSKINEDFLSQYSYDNIKVLNFLIYIYKVFYGWQDKFVDWVEIRILKTNRSTPSSFFTSLISLNGLGFQYLVIILALLLKKPSFIFEYFVFIANFFLVCLLILRKLKTK